MAFLACLFVGSQTALADFVFGEPTRVPNVSMPGASGPQISRDGLELYFVYESENNCQDLWVARRSSLTEEWSAPVRLDPPVNSPWPVGGPCISADGLELYFSDGLPGVGGCVPNVAGHGGGDIWVSKRTTRQHAWGNPVNLGPAVNTGSYEDHPCLTSDGLSLYFTSDRSGSYTLWMTTRPAVDAPWDQPEMLGAPVTGLDFATTPFISPDGLSLYFAVGGSTPDIYVSKRASVTGSWGPRVPFGPVNSPGAEYHLSLANGDSRLYYTRADNVFGGYDLWQVEVIPVVDFNGDGLVDSKDVSVLMDHWGLSEPLCDIGPKPFGDGIVDSQDLKVLAEYLPAIRRPGTDAADVPRDAILSWIGSPLADTYDVYFGTSLDDVSNAERVNSLDVLVSQGQDANSYDPNGLLEFGRTYYVRIDEVGVAPDFTIRTGFVSSFTAERYSYPLHDVTATSNATSAEGETPDNTINGAGLDADGQHSNAAVDMWLGAPAAGEPVQIRFDFDQVYKLHEVRIWNHNTPWEMYMGYGLKDITVEHSADGAEWMSLGDFQLARAAGSATYAGETIALGGVSAKSVRITAVGNYGGPKYGLSEVQFLYIPTRAWQPQPADGATGVAPEVVLRWRAGRDAVAHEVYLATDRQAVLDGTAWLETVAESSYQPSSLDRGQTYYWKITEVNEAETPSRWEGDVWGFTTNDW